MAPSTVTRLIKRGLPAKKLKGVWWFDPDQADKWIRQNAPRISGLTKIDVPESPPGPSPASSTASAERHIDRIDSIIGATLNPDKLEPRTIAAVKQLCTELRLLERHRLEMRQAERELINRAEHERVVGTIAQVVTDEIRSFAGVLPDRLIAALSKAGIKLRSARKARTALAKATEDQADKMRDRIAAAIENSGI